MSAALAPRGLRQLQRWFADTTTQADGSPRGEARLGELEGFVTAGPRLTAAARLQIYSDSYSARLVECLLDDYPALAYALDRDTFEALCRDYIATHPSRSPSLNGYGRQLSTFCLTRREAWAGFAADLSRLEWALVEVVHDSPAAPLDLATVPPERLPTARLLANPGLRLLRLDYPVNAFYQAFRDDQRPGLPERAASAVAVYRRGLTLWRQALDVEAALLLQDLLRGASLERAIARLSRRTPSAEAAAKLTRQLPLWFGSWIERGFFSGIELE